MRNRLKLAASAAVLAMLWQTGAQAVVIDFDGLVGSGTVERGFTYTEDGFVLDNLRGTDLRSIHSGGFSFTGSVSFANGFGDGITRLTKSGGGVFDLDSIDLDSYNSFEQAVTVTFTGTLLDTSTVTQSFTTDAVFAAMQTFAFGEAFNSVTKVEWTQAFPFHHFDNIVLDAPDVSQVPEPMTLTLLGAGLAGLGAVRRRITK